MNRPKTSQKIIDLFSQIVDSQDGKGIQKYGVTIDDAKDSEWEWNRMALEEAIDGMKYLAKENRKLLEENRKLKTLAHLMGDFLLKQ